MLRDAMEALGLATGSAKGKGKDFVNLPRLAAAFPEVVIVVADIIGNSRWKLIEDLPECVSFVGANALIPNNWTRLKELHYVWTIEFNRIIGSPTYSVGRFWEISEKSTLLSEEKKYELMARVGLFMADAQEEEETEPTTKKSKADDGTANSQTVAEPSVAVATKKYSVGAKRSAH